MGTGDASLDFGGEGVFPHCFWQLCFPLGHILGTHSTLHPHLLQRSTCSTMSYQWSIWPHVLSGHGGRRCYVREQGERPSSAVPSPCIIFSPAEPPNLLVVAPQMHSDPCSVSGTSSADPQPDRISSGLELEEKTWTPAHQDSDARPCSNSSSISEELA